MSQRGLSGRSQIPMSLSTYPQLHTLSDAISIPKSCTTGISACSATGSFQAKFVVYFTVPNTVHAAMMEPTYQSVLYIVVSLPRCCGWASSMIRSGADPWDKFDLSSSASNVLCEPDGDSRLPHSDQETSSDEHAAIDLGYN